MEQGGKVRVKLVPRPVTFSVTGTTFFGSSIELVASRLSAFSTVAVPSSATELTPLISIFTSCGASARFTTLTMILPEAVSRVAE